MNQLAWGQKWDGLGHLTNIHQLLTGSQLQQCPRQIFSVPLTDVGLPSSEGCCPGWHVGQEAVFTPPASRKVRRFGPVLEKLVLIQRRFWVPPSCDDSQEYPWHPIYPEDLLCLVTLEMCISSLVLLRSWWAIWKFHPMITPESGRPFVTTNPRNRFFLHPVCQHSL